LVVTQDDKKINKEKIKNFGMIDFITSEFWIINNGISKNGIMEFIIV